MSNKQSLVSHFDAEHGSLRSYVIGFLTCIVLTLVAYFTAVTNSISDQYAVAIIACLAMVQCIVQLRRFLHLGSEFKPRWKLAAFYLMLSIVLIVVAGSIWIMSNLNYRMLHSPAEMRQYVEEHDGL